MSIGTVFNVAKWLSLIAGFSGLGIACSYPAKSAAEASEPPSANSTLTATSAQGQRINVTRLYNETCSKCHGERGEGGGGGTQSLLTREKFDQKFDRPYFDAIKNGVEHAGMEAYGSTLSDSEIWALVVHIRELQARALRAEFGSPKETNGVYNSQRAAFRVETVVEDGKGLRTPWSVDWLPDGRFIVTNRNGSMHLVRNGQLSPAIEGMPAVLELGQGGLMDVAVHPNYAKNGWVYLSYTDPAKSGERAGMTKIVRGKLKFEGEGARWTDQQTIWESDQKFYSGNGVHFGSRIVFDGKGNIVFAVGERGGNQLAQELTNPFGKMHRVKEDGAIPADNPYVDADSKSKGYLASIWTYGHRNPQGLVFDLNGVLWDTEHAPRGGDEVNRIDRGANYGWPIVGYGINYNDSPFNTPWPKPGQNVTLPIFRWLPSTGASGLDVARGAAFPQWKGDLLAGGLAGQNLDRIRVKDGKLVEREELLHGMGRIRDVATAPDGTIYVVLNGPDKIVRLVPAK